MERRDGGYVCLRWDGAGVAKLLRIEQLDVRDEDIRRAELASTAGRDSARTILPVAVQEGILLEYGRCGAVSVSINT